MLKNGIKILSFRDIFFTGFLVNKRIPIVPIIANWPVVLNDVRIAMTIIHSLKYDFFF